MKAQSTHGADVILARRVDSLLSLMTLEEKIGQLNQYTGDRLATGPLAPNSSKYAEIRGGKVGSMLNVRGAKDTRALQELALQSRLRIPLIFGLDVIHGYRVTFPVPLAEAASWDLEAIEGSARIAATEAAGAGIHWTFAPMVDVSRDPRWGRVTEGAGEDPFLGSAMARARVRGFQGRALGDTASVMACVKHFAAYGAPLAGRDYAEADMSLRQLFEIYLPPYKAALDAGAATFMNAFNLLNGVPATASSFLQRDLLKGLWGFTGFVVSDWGSIGELVPHGFAANKADAARLALAAGSDMDMESRSYTAHLDSLVRSGAVPMAQVDDAVRRVLRKKFELGLFDDPFRYCNEAREQRVLNDPGHRQAARDLARKTIVLLKNQSSILPLRAGLRSMAVIGPLGRSGVDLKGAWSVPWENDSLVSLYDGLKARLGAGTRLSYARGCGITDSSRSGFAEAVEAARRSEVVVLALGESWDMSGEAKSRTNIHLPGVQEELVRALVATGKPIVAILFGGRPMIFNYTAEAVPALLYAWFPGSEGGHALADVLFGDYNPSAKLPMSFPRSEGQIPVFYNQTMTGRPVTDEKNIRYKSAYIDAANTPAFPFGHGLSYTQFAYEGLKLNPSRIGPDDTAWVECTLRNTGKRRGEEVVQLYLRDPVASIARPVKELKGFEKIALDPGAAKTIRFALTRDHLSFYNSHVEWTSEPGKFLVMIGSSSTDIRLQGQLELVEGPDAMSRKVERWLTLPREGRYLERGKPEGGEGGTELTLSESDRYQVMAGFGWALTGGSAGHLMKMQAAARRRLLEELFSTTGNGIGGSYLRISIGASDLNERVYSYNDLPKGRTDTGLARFDLGEDRKAVLPVLKEILDIHPGIGIMASPWSAPAWMKTNEDTRGGSLRPEYYGVYAQYFVRYLQAMAAEGIPIDAVTVQNEPLHPGNNPSMYMTAEEQARFVRDHLGPALRRAGLRTHIIVYDHNADRVDYPMTILNDTGARKWVQGSAFHLYGGKIDDLAALHDAHPDKDLYFTEQWVGAPGNAQRDILEHIRNLVIGASRNWCRTVIEWNLSSAPDLKPFTDRGGCGKCLGAVTLDGDAVTRNPAYYIIAHAARFVPAGSVRIGSPVSAALPNVAFVTPAGKRVLVVCNPAASAQSLTIRAGSAAFSDRLPAGAVSTYVW